MPHEPITYASLAWQENGEPYSPQFKDVYFRQDQGVEETRYVFLTGLAERWKQGECFTIAETGFGAGLNFLSTWQLWRTAKTQPLLHYISFEQFPIRPADLRKIYALWPELQPLGEALLAQYPPLVSGFHRVELDGITLTLVWGEVNAMLPGLESCVDAWFLDGFAPRNNPDMWNAELFQHMARLSQPGASIATFTAAGNVRRGLQAVGFAMEKLPGFDAKRDMLRGVKQTPPDAPGGMIKDAPWFRLPAKQTDKRAVVIGGGLAGTSVAYSLARRDWEVTLIERHPQLAMEASGNPSGVIMPLIAAPDDPVGEFYLHAYMYALRHFQQLGIVWHPCGVLELAAQYKNPAPVMHPVSAQEASLLAGISLKEPGWYFPQGGWVSPPLLCRAQASHKRIRVITHSEAIALQDQWKVTDRQGELIAEAPVVIIANAQDALGFAQCQSLPLRRVRGQISFFPATKQSRKLQTVLCYEGYTLPAENGVHSVGATFHPDNAETELRPEDHQENLKLLQTHVPEGFIAAEAMGGRVAFRTHSPDRRPLIGPVPDAAGFKRDYADLHHGKQYKTYPQGAYYPGLYMSVGHGARGLVSTPLAAELLACEITAEPLPMAKHLADAVNPARFLIRGLRQAIE